MPQAVSDSIHPTAVIGPDAELADDVQVGPLHDHRGAGDGRRGYDHRGPRLPTAARSRSGRDNFVGHGAVLGKTPQHRGYRGEPTLLRIGDGNVIREHVTIHRGTVAGPRRDTRIGDRNMLMVGGPPRPRLPCRQRLHAGQRRAARRALRAARRLHPLGLLGRPAAGPDRPAGDARRARLDDEGHPAVRAPAGVQLRLGPEPRRASAARGSRRRRSPPSRGRVPHPLQGRADAGQRPRADRGGTRRNPRGRRVRLFHPRDADRYQHGGAKGRGRCGRRKRGVQNLTGVARGREWVVEGESTRHKAESGTRESRKHSRSAALCLAHPSSHDRGLSRFGVGARWCSRRQRHGGCTTTLRCGATLTRGEQP